MKIILFLIALTFSSQSFAKLSYCENLKVVEDLKNGWRMELSKMQTDHALSFDQKLRKTKNLSARGLRLLYLVDQDTEGKFENKELISQVKKIITNVNKDSYTADASYKMLSFTLPKLEGALENTVFHGQLKGSCDVGLGRPVEMRGVKARR